jgi:DNA-binding NtrC family response regulator
VSEKLNALIVDDEPDMLDFLERALRRRFRVQRANNPEEALEFLDKSEFDLLLTDQKMPKMSGLELLEKIEGQHPNLVKVLISGFAERPDIKEAQEKSRIHNYVFKPVDTRKLIEAIDRAFETAKGD